MYIFILGGKGIKWGRVESFKYELTMHEEGSGARRPTLTSCQQKPIIRTKLICVYIPQVLQVFAYRTGFSQ